MYDVLAVLNTLIILSIALTIGSIERILKRMEKK